VNNDQPFVGMGAGTRDAEEVHAAPMAGNTPNRSWAPPIAAKPHVAVTKTNHRPAVAGVDR